eukprot:387823-Hanusia_phi.AAC.1
MQARRSGGLQLVQMTSKLPSDAKVDPNQAFSLTVRAGSIGSLSAQVVQKNPGLPQTTPFSGGSRSCS